MDGGGQALQQVLFFGLLIFGLYFLAIRPQRARAKALAQVRAAVRIGSEVITTAGIYAVVTGIDGDILTLEIAPGVHVRFAGAAIVRLVEQPEGDPAPDDDAP